MKTKWKEIPLMQRIVTMVSILASLAVIVLAVLQIFNIWNQAVNVCVPLLCVIMLCQAYTQWKNNRRAAWFSIAAAAVILACAIGVFFIS